MGDGLHIDPGRAAHSGPPGGATGLAGAPRRRRVCAAAAVLGRIILEPVVGEHSPFILALLAVVLIAWHRGFGPALVTLCLGMLGTVTLIVLPRGAGRLLSPPEQIGVGLFFLCGIVTA